MNIVNLTPHALTLVTPSGAVTIPPSGTVARVAEEVVPAGTISIEGAEIPLVVKRFGEVVGLPEPEPGVLYIVSALVFTAAVAAGRTDVACPGEPVRNDAGQVVGARSLCVAH